MKKNNDFKPNTLSQFKLAAFDYGCNLRLFEEFNNDTKFWQRDYSGGKFMEVVVAWMLGYFRGVTGVHLHMLANFNLDKKGVDFLINRIFSIDLKFDKDEIDDWHLSNADHVIVRVYPSKKGHSSSGKTMTGRNVLLSVLSIAFRPNVIERNLVGREEFLKILDNLWDKYSNGW